jgi:prepilin-type N-terminal cleavage/methylation domain-containing protein
MSAQKYVLHGFTPDTKNLVWGFTLIELLITIAIIGILSAAVLVGLNPAQKMKQAGDSKVKSDVGQAATALQSYYILHQYYPLSGTGNMNTALTGAGDLGAALNTTTYTYLAYKASGGTVVCDNAAVATYCGAASISGALQTGLATNSGWCYKTATGVISDQTVCAP